MVLALPLFESDQELQTVHPNITFRLVRCPKQECSLTIDKGEFVLRLQRFKLCELAHIKYGIWLCRISILLRLNFSIIVHQIGPTRYNFEIPILITDVHFLALLGKPPLFRYSLLKNVSLLPFHFLQTRVGLVVMHNIRFYHNLIKDAGSSTCIVIYVFPCS